MNKFNPGRYVQGVRRRKTVGFDRALAIVAEERGWVDRRTAENRTPSMPRVKFLEGPPPELYGLDDWRERVIAWRIEHGQPLPDWALVRVRV